MLQNTVDQIQLTVLVDEDGEVLRWNPVIAEGRRIGILGYEPTRALENMS